VADEPISPKTFGASFRGFMEQMAREAPTGEEPFFRARLREHFGADPATLAIVGEKIEDANHPNLHLAIESYVATRTSELLGITSQASFMGITMAMLVAGRARHGDDIAQGPVSYKNVQLDGDRRLACTALGLYLVSDGDARLAILVARTPPQ
jgi:hypothetical protein